MAEAIFNNLSKSAQATSAGTSPAKEIDPLTIQVLNEIDIKPKILAPKLLENSDLDSADIIVSFGCLVPGMFPKDKFREWLVDDPKTIEEYRKVRDEIREKVKTLISEVT